MSRAGPGALVGGAGGYGGQGTARVVVWEWRNEHGRWRPYSAATCHHIENVLKENPRGTVLLGHVEPQLAPYAIDLQNMHQFRQDTGTMRPVQRNFYEPSSAPERVVCGSGESDFTAWAPVRHGAELPLQHRPDEKQHPWLDLTSLGFPYLLDFSAMLQTNRQSQRCRPPCRAAMGSGRASHRRAIPKSQSLGVGRRWALLFPGAQ
ncbi:hypothetical protein AALO_G00074370 [Alosa alosa]|uniref:E3 ubiquitin-protein ligase n=1 Tax=Alosa alosa TaxID=278164 RepID=A0AAV6H7I5_9TELE|nr:hypothetical protein AALO_G00074370 [Alosa alosa]